MLRSAAIRDVGLFDDGFFLYFEEVELMHRLSRSGWTVRHVPVSRVKHAEGASTGLGPGCRLRSMPDYWYESRRRYFARVGGRTALIGANAASISGRAIAAVKRVFGGKISNDRVRTRALVRSGLWARRRDLCASVPSWNDPPGRPPAWMTHE
jgi:hypothetical protein